MWSWHTVVWRRGPWATPLIRKPHDPQTIVLECHWLLAAAGQVLVEDVQHFQKRHVGSHRIDLVGDESSRRVGIFLPPDSQGELHVYL
jgi:hypothetical protein